MKRTLFGCLALILCLAGCAVVNVYVTFPEEKIEKAAEDLLAPPAKDSPGSFLHFRFTEELYAQEAVEVRRDVKTDSPVIREAKSRMDSWREKLDGFKKAGFIGEKNNFEVEIREMPGDSSLARDVRQIASGENRERRVMMNELLKINNVAPGEEAKFKHKFAEVAQRYSPGGTWIQTEKGEWKKK